MNALPDLTPTTLVDHTPADLIGLLISLQDRVPRTLFDACVAHGDAMVQALVEFSARIDARNDDNDEDDDAEYKLWWMELHTLFLLGALPGEAAGHALLDALRRADGEEDHTLLDWIAGDFAALFANKPCAIIDAARTAVADRNLSWYLRCNLLDIGLAAALAESPQALDAELDHIAASAADPDDDPDFRWLAGNALMDFPRARHRDLLLQMAAEQLAKSRFGRVFDASDVSMSDSDGPDLPSWLRRDAPWRFYDDDQIAARQQRWRDEEARADQFLDDVNARHAAHQTVQRLAPKIGRNDPCPCGSGKKYKKCCIALDEAASKP
jgi:hypothetical protein